MKVVLDPGAPEPYISVFASEGLDRTLMYLSPKQADSIANVLVAAMRTTVKAAKGESVSSEVLDILVGAIAFSVKRETSHVGDSWQFSFYEREGIDHAFFIASTTQARRFAALMSSASAAAVDMMRPPKQP